MPLSRLGPTATAWRRNGSFAGKAVAVNVAVVARLSSGPRYGATTTSNPRLSARTTSRSRYRGDA